MDILFLFTGIIIGAFIGVSILCILMLVKSKDEEANRMRKMDIDKHFFFNKDEAELLKSKAEKVGLSESEFVRQLIKGFVPHEKPDKEFYKEMSQLTAIGNRINQLTAKAHSLNFIDAPLLENESKKWADFQQTILEKFILPTSEK